MVARVILDSTAASPLRISAAGTDVNSAEFNTLIFDANQPPLRLWGSGWGSVPGITLDDHNGGKNINTTVIASGFTTPGSLPAIFTCTQRGADSPVGISRLYTPWITLAANGNFGGGVGFGISGGVINGINTNWTTLGGGSTPGAVAVVSYAVFKNY